MVLLRNVILFFSELGDTAVDDVTARPGINYC